MDSLRRVKAPDRAGGGANARVLVSPPHALRRSYDDDEGTIHVPGLKVTVPLAADALPRDLVPREGPAGEPPSSWSSTAALTAQARLNGKNYRKVLKQVAEHGAGNVAVVLQGVLRPPAATGGPFVLEGAGFQVNIKTPRSAEPAGEPPLS